MMETNANEPWDPTNYNDYYRAKDAEIGRVVVNITNSEFERLRVIIQKDGLFTVRLDDTDLGKDLSVEDAKILFTDFVFDWD